MLINAMRNILSTLVYRVYGVDWWNIYVCQPRGFTIFPDITYCCLWRNMSIITLCMLSMPHNPAVMGSFIHLRDDLIKLLNCQSQYGASNTVLTSCGQWSMINYPWNSHENHISLRNNRSVIWQADIWKFSLSLFMDESIMDQTDHPLTTYEG